ncbi:uncharacterized protein LOC115632480 [Scaptodrosophila lebanonensis]|uniref:Uncharacterized protein LOC115632480 n=1 Tax=Drosophila lebanonensis TaxID=7225 RepID=A0A6J2UEG3_DROLE|nr:uncharacterized protein LOC115632480 [Scaptodrosophila lebanonensis]
MDKAADSCGTAIAEGLEDQLTSELVIYDYMKYQKKKKNKAKKHVRFNQVVETATFSENYKIRISESVLGTEEEQANRKLKRRNF